MSEVKCDLSWLSMLGLEEMKQVLDREGLCVQSEASCWSWPSSGPRTRWRGRRSIASGSSCCRVSGSLFLTRSLCSSSL